MSVALGQALDHYTAEQWRICRFFGAIKAIEKEKGLNRTALGLLVATVGLVYSLTASGFCIKGSADSVNTTIYANNTLDTIAPLADIGGFVSVAIGTILAIGNGFIRITREGEYYKLKSFCKKWIVANKAAIISDLQGHSDFYSELNDLWDYVNTNCLFSKSLLSRRLTVLDLYNKAGLPDAGAEMLIDRQLEPILEGINRKISKKTSCGKCCCVIASGQKSYYQSSALGQGASLIIGIVVPILFFSVIVLSWTGGVTSAIKVFNKHEGNIGNLGAYAITALAAASAMIVLPIWALINEGTFTRTKEVYAKKLAKLQHNVPQHNRLCELANQDLHERADICLYAKFPLRYKFSTI